ncbi:MAG: hypothetical protein HYW88_01255, partial [Candidatus Sungbacteria bacterium]|nr:hypothetical protein [Candidatus Sungbacteria bacterium]
KIPSPKGKEGFLLGANKEQLSALLEQKVGKKGIFEKNHPPVRIELYYSRHETFENISELKKKFVRSHMFIPELVGWDEILLKGLHDVAAGKRRPESLFMDSAMNISDRPFNRQLVKMIYGSHKPIRFIDLSLRDPLFKEVASFHRAPLIAVEQRDDSFEKTIDNLTLRLTYYADILRRREKIIVERLGEAIEDVLREKPELQNEKVFFALIQMGAAHSNVSRMLGQKGWDVKKTFQPFPYVFPQESEIIRRAYFQKPISPDLSARFILGRTVRDYLEKRFASMTDVLAAERIGASLFTFEEIKKIYRGWRTKYPEKTSLPDADFDKEVRSRLKEKNIKLPSTEKELRLFLSRKK